MIMLDSGVVSFKALTLCSHRWLRNPITQPGGKMGAGIGSNNQKSTRSPGAGCFLQLQGTSGETVA